MSAAASRNTSLGGLPPKDAQRRLELAHAFLRRLGECGCPAEIAAFMWAVFRMNLVERERLILARWPNLSFPDQIRASQLYRRIRDADARARRSAAR